MFEISFSTHYTGKFKNKDWYAEVSKISMMEKLANEADENNYIIISTYASFVRKEMFDLLNNLPKNKFY